MIAYFRCVRALVVLFIIYFVFYGLGVWSGRDFPQEHELQYAEGIIQTHKDSEGNRGAVVVNVVELIDGNNQGTNYYCNYSAYFRIGMSQCINEKEISNYLGKPAKIGWYMQKDYLFFHNPYPQLVTLEVDGALVRDYHKSLERIAHDNKKDKEFISFFLIPLSVFFLLLSCIDIFIGFFNRNNDEHH